MLNRNTATEMISQATPARWRLAGSTQAGGGNARDVGPWSGRPGGPEDRSMTTDDRISKLETKIRKLESQQTDLRKQLAEAQLDQWQGRIENLEVQMHLGAMEASDELTTLMNRLRGKWADARQQFEKSISTASSVGETVRTGLENAVEDLRRALLESRSKLP